MREISNLRPSPLQDTTVWSHWSGRSVEQSCEEINRELKGNVNDGYRIGNDYEQEPSPKDEKRNKTERSSNIC